MWANEIYAKGAVPPGLALAVIVLANAALVAGVVVALLRARTRAALAVAAEATAGGAAPVLVEGADVVLRGVVRFHEGRAVAVKVSVHQEGREYDAAGEWAHRWTEVKREVIAEPFVLELDSGERVLVTPPKHVDLADALDHVVWCDRAHRIRSAELRAGEQIFVRGRLERSDRAAAGAAYRDTQWGWALVPSDNQMLLSSEPFGVGLRQRARFHRRAAAVAIVMLVAMQASLVTFYDRLIGETVNVEFSRGPEFSYLTIRGETFEIAPGQYNRLHARSTIPIRIGGESNWELGTAATIGVWHAVTIAAGALAFWGLYNLRRARTRPWFRRRLDHAGHGRLPDPPSPTAETADGVS